MALTYESHADKILIVILIEILHVLTGNNEPFEVTPSTSSG